MIGERVGSPSAIVYLVVKLRLKFLISNAPQDDKKQELDVDVDEVKRRVKQKNEQEEECLKSHSDAEEMKSVAEYAHTHWHGVCCLPFAYKQQPIVFRNENYCGGFVLADEKSNRVLVPLKITDIPYARLPHADADEALLEHDYRAYKIQFQSPNVGMFMWKVYISDTFVSGEVTRDITVSFISSLCIDYGSRNKIEEAPLAAADEVEDEISDPDEDSLAGQMAAMHGGSVKKRQEESDDEDSLDEESSDDSSSSNNN